MWRLWIAIQVASFIWIQLKKDSTFFVSTLCVTRDPRSLKRTPGNFKGCSSFPFKSLGRIMRLIYECRQSGIIRTTDIFVTLFDSDGSPNKKNPIYSSNVLTTSLSDETSSINHSCKTINKIRNYFCSTNYKNKLKTKI